MKKPFKYTWFARKSANIQIRYFFKYTIGHTTMEQDKTSEKELTDLEALKEQYKLYAEMYTLPPFEKLNELFDIEEAHLDTEFVLRKIRRIISDKLANYMRFIEALLNPSNAPLYFFNLVRKLDAADKEFLSNSHKNLGQLDIKIVKLDLHYSEKNEAAFIKELYEFFCSDIREQLYGIVDKLCNGKGEAIVKNSSYFG